MKINDVFTAYNEVLSVERITTLKQVNGHFVFRTTVNKLMGNYRKYTYTLDFINKDLKPVIYLEKEYTVQVPAGQEGEIIKGIDRDFLFTFFKTQREKVKDYKLLLTGEYGIK